MQRVPESSKRIDYQKVRDALQWTTFAVGISAFTFQCTVLYPWHEKLEHKFEDLEKRFETIENRINLLEFNTMWIPYKK